MVDLLLFGPWITDNYERRNSKKSVFLYIIFILIDILIQSRFIYAFPRDLDFIPNTLSLQEYNLKKHGETLSHSRGLFYKDILTKPTFNLYHYQSMP